MSAWSCFHRGLTRQQPLRTPLSFIRQYRTSPAIGQETPSATSLSSGGSEPPTSTSTGPKLGHLSLGSSIHAYDKVGVLRAVDEVANRASAPPPPDAEYRWATQQTKPAYEREPGNQYSGRSVDVKSTTGGGGGGGGFAAAYKTLSIILGRNQVKKELRLAAFHEKPSNMKRRLEMQRHRRRFQELVRQKVQLVQTIKNRRQN